LDSFQANLLICGFHINPTAGMPEGSAYCKRTISTGPKQN